ncbi:MAG: tetratricopeptide repeat protein [Sedimentisphaerales bacterium]|nr:tetratricopeptide repeat protein [Sedimentisphaerales bacterium]
MVNKRVNRTQSAGDGAKQFWICLVLAAAATAVYYQVYSYEFVNFDDPVYVYANPHIRTGLTGETIKWALTAGYAANWHPLTWLSHAMDWQLYSFRPGGHHVTSLIFHVANTVLLFIVLYKMTKAFWPSAYVAALFALHPMHVESVAWVSERKDVLSTFFWMLTMLAYASYVYKPKIRRYLLILLFFALGLMSKPMLVTVPFVLLLLDFWPLERMSFKSEQDDSRRSILYLVIEKIPLFLMVIASSVVTFIVQRKAGAMTVGEEYGPVVRIANAAISYVQYIIKMLWPVRLAMFYPHQGKNISFGLAGGAAVLLLLITIVILRFGVKRRYLITGWFWYLGTLVPVIGIVQVGTQAFSDRYSYITLTGLFIIIAWGGAELFVKWHRHKSVGWTASIMILFVLAVCAHLQQSYWKNSLTLCEHALLVTRDNYKAHFSIGPILIENGRFEEAIRHNKEALRIRPNSLEALNGLAVSLHSAGKIDEAVDYYIQILQMDPNMAVTRANLAMALTSQGKVAEAVEHYRIVAEATDAPQNYFDYGKALLQLGRYEEAEKAFRKALPADPHNPDVLCNLASSLYGQKKVDEAIGLFKRVLEINPNHRAARENLSVIMAKQNKN